MIIAHDIRRLERDYDSAILAEERATTERVAWRLAAVSERCLRRLQAARAGRPLPEPRLLPTPRNRARQGLTALASIGVSIGRAITRSAALQKARASLAARRLACLARRGARRAVLAVAGRALRHATNKEHAMTLTGDTITDEQIRALRLDLAREMESTRCIPRDRLAQAHEIGAVDVRAWEDAWAEFKLCDLALGRVGNAQRTPGYKRDAREACARILNTRAKVTP